MQNSGPDSQRAPSNTKRNLLAAGGLALVTALGGAAVHNKYEADQDLARHEGIPRPNIQLAEYESAPSRSVLRQVMNGELEHHSPLEGRLRQATEQLIAVNKGLNQCIDAYEGLAGSFRALCGSNPECVNQLTSSTPEMQARFRAETTLNTNRFMDGRVSPQSPSNLADTTISRTNVYGWLDSRSGTALANIRDNLVPSPESMVLMESLQAQQDQLRSCQQFSTTLGAALARLRQNLPVVSSEATDAGSNPEDAASNQTNPVQ